MSETTHQVLYIVPLQSAQSLKELENDGLVNRTQYDEMPVRVEASGWFHLSSLAAWIPVTIGITISRIYTYGLKLSHSCKRVSGWSNTLTSA